MLFATPAIAAFSLAVTMVLGLVMGSFLNCLAWRLTHGESVLSGRSHCTSCGHVLSARDLVPVLSWALSRGRCRYCGERVSPRYPATELLCALLYLSVVLRFDLTLEALQMVLFVSALLVLSLTDIDKFIIPNACIVFAAAVRLAYLAATAGEGLGQALVFYLGSGLGVGVVLVVLTIIMDHVLGKESMGGGDIKLLAVAGLYFGWQQCLFLLVVACVLGVVVGVAQMRAQLREGAAEGGPARRDPSVPASAFPWGPSIALACWVTMLVGAPLVSWYVGLLL